MTFDKLLCHLCSKQADTQGKLNRHLKTHTKPFRCETCQKGFALRLDLGRHVKARHRAGNEQYRCHVEECIFTSNRKDNLRRHQAKFHGAALLGSAVKKSGKTTSSPQSSHLSSDKLGSSQLYSESNFMQVAASGNLTRLKTFLDAGLTVETRADDHSTALHCAARAGQAGAVECLLLRGANVNAKNDRGRLPIHEAILSNRPEAVEPFLERMAQEELPALAKEIERYLARSGNIQIVDAYIARLGNNFTERHASTKLKFAIRTGHALLVATLLDDPEVDGNLGGVYSAIHLAAAVGRTKVMEVLLGCHRIDKSLPNKWGEQAIHIAASKGRTAIVEQLIRYPSVDINSQDKGEATPLHYACFNGHWETASSLLEHWESTDADRSLSLDVPPMNAPITKETVLQRFFKHPGFKNPNSKGPYWPRRTLLHKAAEKGDCDMMRVLLGNKNIDVNSKDGFTRSPLMVAAENGQAEAVRLFLQHKDIAVNHRSTTCWSQYQTALGYAKSKKHDGIVDLLLSHGAIDYDANVSSTASTTAHIDNPQSTTLQAEHETQSGPFDNCMDDVPNEAWEEFLDMEDEMDT
ncbi:uncharacterized protein ALTATR162_LOCUS3252 [Alternaria atra]|uniref:C2H2-type domain-containing protein n=1 Tax=Alternaria atra TaxID=119953 RepID=A0A8J2I1E3_9PLEO|nr:uncharacterized protein ALTATR162_LOCUS3252 [Alternaria atra]CAG5153612.1 unnamed protein product [Alternaria atra]